MTPEQWARVKEVFNAALARDADTRDAFVAEASGGDEAVRSEIHRLLAADREPPDVRIIGHYEVRHLLGEGGMGRVYAARDQELGREVALKLASFDSEDAHARLRREAQHASALSHPHLCHIYEVGRADGRLFVVMELVPGRTLADVLREGPLPIANARRYAMEIADALAYAHEHGLMHRDLKSTNVMITPRRGAKVLDFGLARRLDTQQIDALSHSQRSLTAEESIAGTLPYMAPELLRGQPGDQRADIWALGVLLYEMLSGRRPFSGATGFELSAAILHQPPDPLPSTVPAPLRAIVDRCLEKDPKNRYQDAAALHEALQDVNGAARPPGMWRFARPVGIGAAVLVAAGLVIAAIAVYSIGDEVFSNARGYALLEEGAFEQAVEEFESVTESDPDEANAWDSLGEGYLANGMPDRALDAYTRALSIDVTFVPSVLGRALALAALGRYDEALARESSDFSVQAFLLSRVGRYRAADALLENRRREAIAEDEQHALARALLTSAWLQLERREYARALEELRSAEGALAEEGSSSLRVFADLLAGIAEIRAGNLNGALARLDAQAARYDRDELVEARWVAALDAEVALAHGQHDRAAASFDAAHVPAWVTLGGDIPSVFVTSPPSRDGLARLEAARGNPEAAIAEYRRLTTPGGSRPAGVLDPRHVLALARLLDTQGDEAGANAEYARFLKLWASADMGLPETEEARRALARQ